MTGAFADARNLIFFRAILFSLFPLMLALQSVLKTEKRLSRANMRPAFYSQCYAATPFILAIDLGLILASRNSSLFWLGVAVIASGYIWYISVLSRWLNIEQKIGAIRASGLAVAIIFTGTLIMISIALLVSLTI